MTRPDPIEDLLKEPIRLGWFYVAEPPVRYRAFELAGTRYGWTVPPVSNRPARSFLPPHYALTLRLTPFGHWGIVEAKPFEHTEDARRWATGLWSDAARHRPDELS